MSFKDTPSIKWLENVDGSFSAYVKNREDGGIATADRGLYVLDELQYGPIEARRDTIEWIGASTHEATGFEDSSETGVQVTGDGTTRKVTLTHPSGTIDMYENNKYIPLASPYLVDVAHGTDTAQSYFLQYSNGVFAWGSGFDFRKVQVAIASYIEGEWRYFQETHGHNMDWRSHEENHQIVGTYYVPGTIPTLTAGTFEIQPASPTDAHNTFGVDAGVVKDEDNLVTVPAWTQGSYFLAYLTPTGLDFTVGATNPLRSAPGGFVYYQDGDGNDVEATNKGFLNVYVYQLPMALDEDSQAIRTLVLQPQAEYTTPEEALAENHLQLNKAQLEPFFAEFAVCQKVTIQVQASYGTLGKYRIHAVTEIDATREGGQSTSTGTTVHNLLSGRDALATHPATSLTFAPAGDIASTTVQTAIEELDSEKVPNTRTITAGSGLTGGGDLSANRTISHDDTSSVGNLDTSGAQVIDTLTFDGFGHVTGRTTRNITASDVGALTQADGDGRYVLLNPTSTQTINSSGTDSALVIKRTSVATGPVITDQLGTGDLFNARASGVEKYVIHNDGSAESASGFIVTGGLSTQFLKADGSLDSTAYIPESEKGVANGVAELDGTGKVPSLQLPSFVDDVLEYANLASFPATGEDGKIYVAEDTNLTYRWSGSAYVEISASLALGETSSTAYRGDRGKTAYDHSQIVTGNPHQISFADLTSTPTTISGYGITDAYTKTQADARYLELNPTGNQTVDGGIYAVLFNRTSSTTAPLISDQLSTGSIIDGRASGVEKFSVQNDGGIKTATSAISGFGGAPVSGFAGYFYDKIRAESFIAGAWDNSADFAAIGHSNFGTSANFQQLFIDTGRTIVAGRSGDPLQLRGYNASNTSNYQVEIDENGAGFGGAPVSGLAGYFYGDVRTDGDLQVDGSIISDTQNIPVATGAPHSFSIVSGFTPKSVLSPDGTVSLSGAVSGSFTSEYSGATRRYIGRIVIDHRPSRRHNFVSIGTTGSTATYKAEGGTGSPSTMFIQVESDGFIYFSPNSTLSNVGLDNITYNLNAT